MRRAFVVASCAALGVGILFACDNFESGSGTTTPDAGSDGAAATKDDASPSDAGVVAVLDEAGPPINSGQCDDTMPFTGFASLGSNVNTKFNDHNPRLTPDELTLYLGRINTAPDLLIVRYQRAARDQEFALDSQQTIAPGNVVQRLTMWPASDGGHVYYDQLAQGTDRVVYKLFHGVVDGAGKMVESTPLPGVSLGTAQTHEVYPSPDESEIWFSSDRNQAQLDLFHAFATDGGYTEIAPVPNINTAADDRAAVISADGRTIYFASASGRNVGFSIRMATRATTKDAFSFPIEAPGLAPLQDESKGFSAMPGWISPYNCRLYLNTNFDGTQDIYVAWRH
jgi:hypothetical protein